MSNVVFKPSLNISSIIAGTETPPWLLDVVNASSLVIREQSILNMSSNSGVQNLQGFLFRTPKWAINGVYFDGILKTEHKSSVKLTQFPIQSGCMGTDHAVVEPAELTIDVMMSDANNVRNLNRKELLNSTIQFLKSLVKNSNYVEINSDLNGEGRSVNAWTILRGMQLSRTPITVETRLHDYKNMIVEELSTPDDYKTYTAMKCSVRLREIITVGVSSYANSLRPMETLDAASDFGETQSIPVPGAEEFLDDVKKGFETLGDPNGSLWVNADKVANKFFQKYGKKALEYFGIE